MAGSGRKVFANGNTLSASDVQNYLQDQSVMYFANTAARTSAIGSPTTGMVSYVGDTPPQVQTYTGSAWQNMDGLALITSVTIGSAVSSVTVSSCFNATYDTYRVIYSPLASSVTGSNITFRYRTGATDNSNANYNWAGNAVTYAGVATALSGSAQTSGFLGYGSYTTGAAWGTMIIDVVNPFKTEYTSIESVGTGVNATGGVLTRTNTGGYFNANTSFDGITFIPSAGTLTGGTISVYGYRKA